MFTESKIIKQIGILPDSKHINVQWANQVKKGAEVISETFERKAFTVDALDGFISDGITIDLNAFLVAFNSATLDEKVAAVAAKQSAEAALATATTEHASAITALESAHTAALAAKDATIASLQAQIDALTPAPANTVTPAQIRIAMSRAGLRTQVEAAVAAGSQEVQDWYEFATAFERQNPYVLQLATALGVTEQELDDLWALAATV